MNEFQVRDAAVPYRLHVPVQAGEHARGRALHRAQRAGAVRRCFLFLGRYLLVALFSIVGWLARSFVGGVVCFFL